MVIIYTHAVLSFVFTRFSLRREKISHALNFTSPAQWSGHPEDNFEYACKPFLEAMSCIEKQ
uniref:Uncharacterized protein n=1 Tax=Rhizophora mucronata TaxID=61149 RepID=A0A2P2ILY5_RHIMU